MRQLTTFPAIRRYAVASLALLACVLLLPNVVNAGCGDYVLVGGQQPHAHQAAHAKSVHGILFRISLIDVPRNTPGSRSIPEKCTGPNCSNRSTIPALPAPRMSHPVSRWLDLTRGIQAIPIRSSTPIIAAPDSAATAVWQLSIFRPPRAPFSDPLLLAGSPASVS